MSFRELAKAIPLEATPRSLPEEIFRAYLRRELSLEEYTLANAVWVSEKLRKYPPREYTPLSPPLRAYVAARSQNTRAMDSNLWAMLSSWLALTRKTELENDADRDLLLWSKGVIASRPTGMEGRLADLERRIEAFFHTSFPADDYGHGSRVQAMDARDKQRTEALAVRR